MKKICFVAPKSLSLFTNVNYTNGLVGGGEKQLYYIATELSGDPDYEISFCTADYGQKEVERFDMITVYKSFAFSESLPVQIKKFFRALKKIDADLYVFRSADVGILLGLVLVKYFLKKKFLYMVASDSECSRGGLTKAWGGLTAWSMARVYRRADILTVQSRHQEKQFLTHRKIKPAAVVKNSYLFTIDEQDIIKEEKKSILWVGRCEPLKRPEIFIELARRHKDVQFVMIAPSAYKQEAYWEKIKQLAAQESNIEFISYVPPNQIKTYYKKALLYVTTSAWEGFSNTMMEAMECLCPIASLNVNPDNILEEYSLGFCTDDDREAFFTRFTELLGDEAARAAYGKNARSYLEEQHGIHRTVETFKGIVT